MRENGPTELPNIPSLDDFKIVKLIGSGAYGKVSLAYKISNGKEFAIKTMSKEFLYRKNMAEQIIKERNTLALSNSPFIVPLFYSFESKDEVHLVMENMSGGDFGKLIQVYGYFDEKTCRFYIAEASMAIDYLHNLGIIHRDIKPSNFLLSKHGHLKLSDFGLIRVNNFRAPELSDFQITKLNAEPSTPIKKSISVEKLSRTPGQVISLTSEFFSSKPRKKIEDSPARCVSMTICESKKSFKERSLNRMAETSIFGTPDYLAIEIVENKKYDSKIDWWSLGICLYEMAIGFPPFNDESAEKIFDNIQKFKIEFPSDKESLSEQLSEAILELIEINPLKRADFKKLKTLTFFRSVHWRYLHILNPPLGKNISEHNNKLEF